MPMPALLPTIDWRAVHASGLPFAEWLATAQDSAKRTAMETALCKLTLPETTAAGLAALPRPVHVVAIAEDWCGDVVRHVPALERLTQAAPQLHVRYISRAQHLDVFARFLTHGGEAIPKFIFLNDQFVECGHWGPMPEDCKRLIARGKALGDIATARQRVSARYAADPHLHDVTHELLACIDIAASTSL